MNVGDDRSRVYREVLGQYPTGVSIMTAQLDDGTLAGMTVGSFTSVSLDPPLVAFFPAKTSTSWPVIQRAGKFCVNVLAWDQEYICQRMAKPGGEKFADVTWRPSTLGSPIIDGVVAWIDCTIESVNEAGDHYIVMGRVHELEVANQTLPLVFFRGGYGRFTPGPLVSDMFEPEGHWGLLNAARMEMLQLGSELGVECAITGIADGGYALVASTWSPLSTRARVRVGDRVPLVPPLAISFAAGSDPEVRETWINNGLKLGGDASRQELSDLLDQTRAQGWCAGVRPTPRETCVRRLLEVNRRLRAGYASDEEFNLTVPVYDKSGQVVLSLSIYGISPSLAGKSLRACIDRLKCSAREIERLA